MNHTSSGFDRDTKEETYLERLQGGRQETARAFFLVPRYGMVPGRLIEEAEEEKPRLIPPLEMLPSQRNQFITKNKMGPSTWILLLTN